MKRKKKPKSERVAEKIVQKLIGDAHEVIYDNGIVKAISRSITEKRIAEILAKEYGEK